MAQLGVMTTEYTQPTFDAVADAIVADGIGCVQLQLGSVIRNVPTEDALLRGLDALGDRLTPDLAARSREMLARRDIIVAAVEGTYNMVDSDASRRRRNLDRLVTLIGLAGTFGTDIVTLCTGSRDPVMWRPHPDNRSDDAWRDLVERLRVASDAAEAAGVRLAFEPSATTWSTRPGRPAA